MAEEEGIVDRVEGGTAYVKTRRGDACEHCHAKDGCHAMGGGKEMEVAVANTLDAKPGDRVMVSVEDGAFLQASLLVYGVPAVALVAGALAGEQLGPLWGFGRDTVSALTGLVFLAVTFAGVRFVANSLGVRERWKPKMLAPRSKGAGRPAGCRISEEEAGDDALRVTPERLRPPGD
jgi:sigma-E factor negative regulatory protein RseC